MEGLYQTQNRISKVGQAGQWKTPVSFSRIKPYLRVEREMVQKMPKKSTSSQTGNINQSSRKEFGSLFLTWYILLGKHIFWWFRHGVTISYSWQNAESLCCLSSFRSVLWWWADHKWMNSGCQLTWRQIEAIPLDVVFRLRVLPQNTRNNYAQTATALSCLLWYHWAFWIFNEIQKQSKKGGCMRLDLTVLKSYSG